MQKPLLAFTALCVSGSIAFGQGAPSLTVQEADGTPKKTGVTTIVVSNGTLTISGNKATISTGSPANFVGDGGAGGVRGLVPAPAAGDAAAGKYLKADGTWATVAGGGGISAYGLLQRGLVAEYRLDDGAGQRALNSVYSSLSDGNLLFPPEVFTSSTAWAPGSFTVTENYTTNPNGDSTASRAVATAGNKSIGNPSNNLILKAGPYTLSIYVKSNTGGNQTFRLAIYDGSYHYSADLTATTSWQRFGYTYTVPTATASGGVLILSTDSLSNAVDVSIWGAKLEEGPSATPLIPQRFDLALGTSYAVHSSDPTWTNYGLYMNGSQSALGVISSPVTLAQASLYAVVRWRTGQSPVNSSYLPVLGNEYSASTRIAISGGDGSQLPVFTFKSSNLRATAATLNDGNWHLLVGTYDGTTQRLFVDGFELANATTTQTSITMQQVVLGNFNNAGYWPGDIAYAAIYNTGHSAANIAQNTTFIQEKMSQRGITLASAPKIVVFDGDSISVNPGSTANFPYVAITSLAAPVPGRSFAVVGSAISDLVSRAASVDALYSASRTKNVLFVLIGRNDLPALGTSTWYANLKTYCAARKAAGWTVVIGTLLPSTATGFNALRNTANSLIIAEPLGTYWDAVCRFDQVANMGADGDAANTTYYADGTHPTAAGAALLGAAASASLAAIL